MDEDKEIMEYINMFEEYEYLGSRRKWNKMACFFKSGRSWQSLKERFRKRIFPNLSLYVKFGVSQEVVDRIRTSVPRDPSRHHITHQDLPSLK